MAGFPAGFGQTWEPGPGIRAANIVQRIYPDVGLEPLAIIRANDLHREYEKKGFFRIGVLPMVVLDGLRLELCDTNRLAAALAKAGNPSFFGARGFHAIEGRNFSISFSGDNSSVLHAQTVRVDGREDWRLKEGWVLPPGSAPVSFSYARLAVAGPRLGELTCDTTNGTVHFQLLSLANHVNHQQSKL